jgi:hypothetical protein
MSFHDINTMGIDSCRARAGTSYVLSSGREISVAINGYKNSSHLPLVSEETLITLLIPFSPQPSKHSAAESNLMTAIRTT